MDILVDVEHRLIEAGLAREKVRKVIDQLRHDWGGTDAWIFRHNGEPVRRAVFRRNAQIYRDWQAGERVPFLARKYGISAKRVYAVIRSFSKT
jgi:Mor family transcriptional regulator